jgi:hypothetical protein
MFFLFLFFFSVFLIQVTPANIPTDVHTLINMHVHIHIYIHSTHKLCMYTVVAFHTWKKTIVTVPALPEALFLAKKKCNFTCVASGSISRVFLAKKKVEPYLRCLRLYFTGILGANSRAIFFS